MSIRYFDSGQLAGRMGDPRIADTAGTLRPDRADGALYDDLCREARIDGFNEAHVLRCSVGAGLFGPIYCYRVRFAGAWID
jgi:hypothetical protein